jgi:hypothetical protein
MSSRYLIHCDFSKILAKEHTTQLKKKKKYLQILEDLLHPSLPHIGLNWERNSLWGDSSHQVNFVKRAYLPCPSMLPHPRPRKPHENKQGKCAYRSIGTDGEAPRIGNDGPVRLVPCKRQIPLKQCYLRQMEREESLLRKQLQISPYHASAG